jgi:hypothetical protein
MTDGMQNERLMVSGALSIRVDGPSQQFIMTIDSHAMRQTIIEPT